MQNKLCKKCNISKELDEFRIQKCDGKERYCSWCKSCEKEYNKLYSKTEKRKTYRKEYSKKYCKDNKEKLQQKRKIYYQNNKEKIKEKIGKYWEKEWYKEYRRSKEYKEYRKKWLKNKMKVDEVFSYKMYSRQLISRAFYDKTFKKNEELEEIVGCDIAQFKRHLLDTFLNNYNKNLENEKINIDHIIPLSTAKTIEEVKILNNYKNLQLLKKRDNELKGTKLNYKINY